MRGKPINQCVTPRCGGSQYSKGLCRKCFQAAQSIIGRNLTTWDELESLGLTQECTGAKFLAAFNRATNGRLNKPKDKS
jgi:hypothetical protein